MDAVTFPITGSISLHDCRDLQIAMVMPENSNMISLRVCGEGYSHYEIHLFGLPTAVTDALQKALAHDGR